MPRLPLVAALLAASLLARPAAAEPGHGSGATLMTPDGPLYYEIEGHGPPVILVAGGPGAGHASFHPWFSKLAQHNTVIYFDNIGRGRSGRLSSGRTYTVDRDAEDIERLRQALGHPRVAVISHSYGGLPALAYAARHPEHVAALVLSDTAYGAPAWRRNIDAANAVVREQYPEVWADLQALRRQGVRSGDPRYGDPYVAALGDFYWYDLANAGRMWRSGQVEDDFNAEVYRAMLGADPEVRVGGTIRGLDLRPRMARITVPTLIAVGRFDRATPPRAAVEMKAALINAPAELAIFERSGHRPWVEESDAYFERVDRFLAEAFGRP